MIPPLALKLGGAVLAVVLAAGYGYHHGVQRERARTEARIQAAEANARAITARRFQTIQEAQDAEHLARVDAQRDAAAARAAAVSLRERADQFARGLPDDPASACSCASAEARAGVLADLLGRAAERAERLAGEADSARIAGQLCVSAYEALTVK